MADIPAYVSQPQLCTLLGISDDTLRRWQKQGFPAPGRHGRWSWAKVQRYMDGDESPAVPSNPSTSQEEEIRNAHREHQARH